MIYDLTTNEIIEGFIKIHDTNSAYHTNINSSIMLSVDIDVSYYAYVMEWFAHSSSGQVFARKRELFLPNENKLLYGCILSSVRNNMCNDGGFIEIEIISDHYNRVTSEELHNQFRSARRDKKINEILG